MSGISDEDVDAMRARERASERERCAAHLEEIAEKYSRQVGMDGTDVAKALRCGAQSIRDFLKDAD